MREPAVHTRKKRKFNHRPSASTTKENASSVPRSAEIRSFPALSSNASFPQPVSCVKFQSKVGCRKRLCPGRNILPGDGFPQSAQYASVIVVNTPARRACSRSSPESQFSSDSVDATKSAARRRSARALVTSAITSIPTLKRFGTMSPACPRASIGGARFLPQHRVFHQRRQHSSLVSEKRIFAGRWKFVKAGPVAHPPVLSTVKVGFSRTMRPHRRRGRASSVPAQQFHNSKIGVSRRACVDQHR